ncbi:MAG: hypothetical protein M2R45_01475 [Verrucomicrobia subdivision 3 bacterium]|nr:hypothetical protein [Limisphaerales bacterium]MCS1413395.1 hypothetical protein [Limisphaerales bacterium]
MKNLIATRSRDFERQSDLEDGLTLRYLARLVAKDVLEPDQDAPAVSHCLIRTD